MGYTLETWLDRIAQRTDMSSQVVHLTRDRDDAKLARVMYEIVASKTLKGSSTKSGFICGKTPAVCFQDAPLVSVCQNVYYEQRYKKQNPEAKTRYRACGVAFAKPYAFKKGARPVIYEKTADAKGYLPQDQWWRIVNFDLGNDKALVDWTHEREWRSPGDFSFDLSEATLLFVNEPTLKSFLKLCDEYDLDIMRKAKGIVTMRDLLF